MGAESIAEQGGWSAAEAGAKGACVCVRICLLLDCVIGIYILI